MYTLFHTHLFTHEVSCWSFHSQLSSSPCLVFINIYLFILVKVVLLVCFLRITFKCIWLQLQLIVYFSLILIFSFLSKLFPCCCIFRFPFCVYFLQSQNRTMNKWKSSKNILLYFYTFILFTNLILCNILRQFYIDETFTIFTIATVMI